MGVDKRKKTPKPNPLPISAEHIQPINQNDLQRALQGEIQVTHVKGSRKTHDKTQKTLERVREAKNTTGPTANESRVNIIEGTTSESEIEQVHKEKENVFQLDSDISPSRISTTSVEEARRFGKPKRNDKMLLSRKYSTYKKHLKHIHALSHTFDVPASSSSTDRENFYKDQRDSEWLKFTSSESSQDIPLMEYEEEMRSRKRGSQLEIQSDELNKETRVLFWFLKYGGRLPVQSYVEDRVMKFQINKRSPEYVSFLITSIFLIFCTITTFMSLSEIFLRQSFNSTSFVFQVENIELSKYGIYGLATLFYLTTASLWSLGMIFQDGYYFADYLTRWNLIQVQLKLYGEYDGVRRIILLSIAWFMLYSGAFITFFSIEDGAEFLPIPAVRGTANLLAQSIFRLFVPGIRFKPEFSYLGGFGLFIHLYAVYSAQIVMLIVLVYCKIIENMARRWNLRTAYVLGMLGESKSPKEFITYHTIIPFTKLFAEHNFIVFLQKYTGKLFSVGLNGYFILKGLELISLFYYVITHIIYVTPEPPSKFVKGTPHQENITFIDPLNNVMMTGIFYTIQSLLGWLWTSEHLQNAGHCIMCGYSFIRRYGLVRCRNSKERRFVLSMQFSFAPVADYFLNPGVKINRKFILEMLFWIGTITALLIVFNPIRLQKDIVTVCQNDTCIQLSLRKSYWVIGSDRKNLITSLTKNLNTPPTSTTTTSTTTTTIPMITTTTIFTTTIPTTTTIPPPSCPFNLLSKPVQIPPSCNAPTPERWIWTSGPIPVPVVRIPLGCINPSCTPPVPDPDFRMIPFINSTAIEFCPPGSNGVSIPYNDTNKLFDCAFGVPIDKSNRDFCGNLNISTPVDVGGPIQHPKLIAIRTIVNVTISSANSKFVGCCFDYEFRKFLAQAGFCNVVQPNFFEKQCGDIRIGTSLGTWIKEDDLHQDLKQYFNELDMFYSNRTLGKPQRFDDINDCFCSFNPIFKLQNQTNGLNCV